MTYIQPNDTLLVDIDFVNGATYDVKAAGDGKRTIAGHTWNINGSAGTNSWDNINGTGLVIDMPAVHSANFNEFFTTLLGGDPDFNKDMVWYVRYIIDSGWGADSYLSFAGYNVAAWNIDMRAKHTGGQTQIGVGGFRAAGAVESITPKTQTNGTQYVFKMRQQGAEAWVAWHDAWSSNAEPYKNSDLTKLGADAYNYVTINRAFGAAYRYLPNTEKMWCQLDTGAAYQVTIKSIRIYESSGYV